MGLVTRPPSAVLDLAMVVSLAWFCGACSETLDAGHNKPKENPCPMTDAGLGNCTPTGLLDNLVGHWRLDDPVGSTVAFDSSGRGNQGELQSLNPSGAWVDGRSAGALQTAHAGWVQVAPSPSIDSIVQDVTVSAWINLEGEISPDEWAVALSRQVGTGKDQYYHLSIYVDGRASWFLMTDSGFALIKGSMPRLATSGFTWRASTTVSRRACT